MFPVLQVLNLHSTRGPAWTSDWNDGIAPDLVAVKDKLIPRLPSLRCLWLYDMSKLALRWNLPASRSEECFTLHEVGSESDVWDMVELIFPENYRHASFSLVNDPLHNQCHAFQTNFCPKFSNMYTATYMIPVLSSISPRLVGTFAASHNHSYFAVSSLIASITTPISIFCRTISPVSSFTHPIRLRHSYASSHCQPIFGISSRNFESSLPKSSVNSTAFSTFGRCRSVESTLISLPWNKSPNFFLWDTSISKDCTAHWDAFLPMISTPSFSCLGESNEDRVARRELHLWLQLLDLERLQVLHIQLNEEFCFFLTEFNDPTPFSFPLLDSIILDVNLKTLPLLPTLLSKTPALCSLKISLSCVGTPQYVLVMEGLVPPATCPVPSLQDYHGPHMLLPVIFGQAVGSPSTYLRRMFLGSVDPAGDGLDSFMNSFQSCDALQLKTVTHIHMSMLHSMDLKSLAKIQDMFPVLQVFKFHTAEYRTRKAFATYVDLADLDVVPLPSTLVSLSIQWKSFWDDGVVPDLVAAKDNLIPRLPNLNRLWLCDLSTQALLWTREASRPEECCTLHEARSQDDVWKMDELRNPQCAIFGSSCWRRRGM